MGLEQYNWDELLSFFLAWEASDHRLLTQGKGWLCEPVAWWTHIYVMRAMMRQAEREVEREKSGGPFNGVRAVNFREIASNGG